jgi:hypothetical protein
MRRFLSKNCIELLRVSTYITRRDFSNNLKRKCSANMPGPVFPRKQCYKNRCQEEKFDIFRQAELWSLSAAIIFFYALSMKVGEGHAGEI